MITFGSLLRFFFLGNGPLFPPRLKGSRPSPAFGPRGPGPLPGIPMTAFSFRWPRGPRRIPPAPLILSPRGPGIEPTPPTPPHPPSPERPPPSSLIEPSPLRLPLILIVPGVLIVPIIVAPIAIVLITMCRRCAVFRDGIGHLVHKTCVIITEWDKLYCLIVQSIYIFKQYANLNVNSKY